MFCEEIQNEEQLYMKERNEYVVSKTKGRRKETLWRGRERREKENNQEEED
jgi:hypothetical protein